MYEVLIWDERVGDFTQEREPDTNKVVRFNTETEALLRAASYKDENIQAKVQFVRNIQRTRKTMKSGRIQRIRTTEFFGERVKIVATFNSSGKKVKA